jgi:hypothetical protein
LGSEQGGYEESYKNCYPAYTGNGDAMKLLGADGGVVRVLAMQPVGFDDQKGDNNGGNPRGDYSGIKKFSKGANMYISFAHSAQQIFEISFSMF